MQPKDTLTLYYVSEAPVELLVPSSSNSSTTPKVCYYTSIQGGLFDKGEDLFGRTFYVYSIDTDEYYTPKVSEAPNVDITGEVWVNFACEPTCLGIIKVTDIEHTRLEELQGKLELVPSWQYSIKPAKGLNEDTRSMLINKSKNVGDYKDKSRGKNRFERKKYSKVANSVKLYNKIDMNKFFKQDILDVSVPVNGETSDYTVSIRLQGVVAEIAKNIKNNKNQLEYRTIVQALTKVFNSGNVWVKCTCKDYEMTFGHWNIIDNVSTDDTAQDPGPGKGIRNPHNDKGRGCKHVLLVLANGDWLMKVASVINNYIHYAEAKLPKPFLNIIFPKLYGYAAEEMVEQDLIDTEEYLDSTEGLIDAINEYGRNRGKFQKGSNKNPTTGTGGKSKKASNSDEDTKVATSSTKDKSGETGLNNDSKTDSEEDV